jgi:transcriptional regulator with XRE-family HTH domain
MALSDQDLHQFKVAIGDRLVAAREERGLDQLELSRRSGVSRVMLSEFERAARIMSLEHFHRLCDGLGVRPCWLLAGEGEKWSDGPTIEQIRDEAWGYRKLDVDFVAAINALLRRYRQDKKLRTWALGGCLRAYWGTQWLGFDDLREVARILEIVCDRCGLDLVEVLESTGHSNASQYTADWLLHRGVDPEAFGPELQSDGITYEVRYHRSLARDPAKLMELAEQKGILKPQPARSKVSEALDYLLGFVRIFDPEPRRK